MSDNEFLEVFFSRCKEQLYNDKLLDDICYVVPKAELHAYIKQALEIPYDKYIDFLINWNLEKITTKDITQNSNFQAAEIDMCKAMLSVDNTGLTYLEIGDMFPELCKTNSEGALRKYGENQVKTSSQLGLTYCYYGKWYLNCIGYIYEELSEENRRKLIARTILRDNLYGTLVRDIVFDDIVLDNYLVNLSDSTMYRRASGILRILKFALDELDNCGLSYFSYSFNRPKIHKPSSSKKKEELTLEFYKKVTKSFISRGITIPKSMNDSIIEVVDTTLNRGEVVPITIVLNDNEYLARLCRINLTDSDRILYQIYWLNYTGFPQELEKYIEDNNINEFIVSGEFGKSKIKLTPSIENNLFTLNVNNSNSNLCNNNHQLESMATLKELYQTKRVLEEYGQEIPIPVINEIEKLEFELMSELPALMISKLRNTTIKASYTGKYTFLVEYADNELIGISVKKNFSAEENGSYFTVPSDVDEVFDNSLDDTLLDDENYDSDSEDYTSDDNRIRSKSIPFEVRFPDGKTIYYKNAQRTMIEALKYIGLERVSAYKDEDFMGFSLVGKEQRVTEPQRNWQQYIDGWWVYTLMGNPRKIRCIQGVAKMLNIPIEVVTKKFDNNVMETEKSHKTARFSLNNSAPMKKNRSVLATVKLLLSEFPSLTFDEVLEMFPNKLQGSYGVVRTLEDIEERKQRNRTENNRWFLYESDILCSSDGIRFAVSNEWGDNFVEFQKYIMDSWGWSLTEVE